MRTMTFGDVVIGVLFLALFAWLGWMVEPQLGGITWPTLWWVGASCYVFGYAVKATRRFVVIARGGGGTITFDTKTGHTTSSPSSRQAAAFRATLRTDRW